MCQIGGWLSYGLTLIFFSYVLERQLSPVFYPRMAINLLLGLSLTHLLRLLILKVGLRPPMPSGQWWKILLLFFGYAVLFSFLISSIFEIFKLYDAGRKMTQYTFPSLNIQSIVSEWNTSRVSKRFFISLVFDTPISLIWISVYMLWHYIEFSNSEAINKIKLESLIKELELKTIKSQINPHFIFNALNSIRALVDENPTRARQAITELSNILRSSIQADKVEITTLEKELTIVKDYLALEYIRFEDRLQVIYEVDAVSLQNKVPPMMLQTLVENAIKYAVSTQESGAEITITTQLVGSILRITVSDTGPGLQSGSASNRFAGVTFDGGEPVSTGVGLANIRDRLVQAYGEDHRFETMEPAEGGFAVLIELPFERRELPAPATQSSKLVWWTSRYLFTQVRTFALCLFNLLLVLRSPCRHPAA